MADSTVVVGGEYRESDDFVPNPSDITKQFNTSGLGASGRLEETTPVFQVDKVKTAEQILAALDPEDDSVKSSAVVLPDMFIDNDDAKDDLRKVAQARVDKGVVIGEPGPAEAAAATEYDTEATDLRAEGTADETTGLAAKHSGVTAVDSAASTGSDAKSDGDTSSAPDTSKASDDARTDAGSSDGTETVSTGTSPAAKTPAAKKTASSSTAKA